MGASTKDERAVAAVAIKTVATGVVEARIEVSGIDPDDSGSKMSFSATPNTAPRKLLKKVSNVRSSMLYTNVEFVARHMASAPLSDERAERASISECGFFRTRWPSRVLFGCCFPDAEDCCDGRPRLPRGGERLEPDRPDGALEVK